ncbi:MAG TPA: ribose-phosphate diphosphokinase [Candidatus Altiarchaeales archaeon]|nr:ribose-phosphate diphosphokinase [Candidatus Altiarchaeales archaeon]
MIVFGGQNTAGLAWEVAKELKRDLGKLEYKRFPDGESCLRVLENVKGKDCAVISSVKSNDDLVELFLLLDCLRDVGAHQVHAILPYLAYMRQDKIFRDGEPLSAKTVLRILDELSDSITTVNVHFMDHGGVGVFNKVRFENIDATETLVDYFRPKLKKPVCIAPDKGSVGWAKKASELLDCDFDHLDKTRISGSEVSMREKTLNVKGRDVLILDDIISTGGTIVEACKIIRKYRPASVNVGCVHGLFLNGIDIFQGAVDRIVATNTLESNVSKASIAPLLARHLK